MKPITSSSIDNVYQAGEISVSTAELRGYELVTELFTDSSGFGGDDEPALSLSQFERKVRQLVSEHGKLWAGVTGVGQFQCWIGLFKKSGRKPAKKLASNVYLYVNEQGERVVRLYNTDIITEHANGTLTLDTGGYNTMTTSKRINQFSDVYVYRKNWIMHAKSLEFVDNKITIEGALTV